MTTRVPQDDVAVSNCLQLRGYSAETPKWRPDGWLSDCKWTPKHWARMQGVHRLGEAHNVFVAVYLQDGKLACFLCTNKYPLVTPLTKHAQLFDARAALDITKCCEAGCMPIEKRQQRPVVLIKLRKKLGSLPGSERLRETFFLSTVTRLAGHEAAAQDVRDRVGKSLTTLRTLKDDAYLLEKRLERVLWALPPQDENDAIPELGILPREKTALEEIPVEFTNGLRPAYGPGFMNYQLAMHVTYMDEAPLRVSVGHGNQDLTVGEFLNDLRDDQKEQWPQVQLEARGSPLRDNKPLLKYERKIYGAHHILNAVPQEKNVKDPWREQRLLSQRAADLPWGANAVEGVHRLGSARNVVMLVYRDLGPAGHLRCMLCTCETMIAAATTSRVKQALACASSSSSSSASSSSSSASAFSSSSSASASSSSSSSSSAADAHEQRGQAEEGDDARSVFDGAKGCEVKGPKLPVLRWCKPVKATHEDVTHVRMWYKEVANASGGESAVETRVAVNLTGLDGVETGASLHGMYVLKTPAFSLEEGLTAVHAWIRRCCNEGYVPHPTVLTKSAEARLREAKNRSKIQTWAQFAEQVKEPELNSDVAALSPDTFLADPQIELESADERRKTPQWRAAYNKRIAGVHRVSSAHNVVVLVIPDEDDDELVFWVGTCHNTLQWSAGKVQLPLPNLKRVQTVRSTLVALRQFEEDPVVQLNWFEEDPVVKLNLFDVFNKFPGGKRLSRAFYFSPHTRIDNVEQAEIMLDEWERRNAARMRKKHAQLPFTLRTDEDEVLVEEMKKGMYVSEAQYRPQTSARFGAVARLRTQAERETDEVWQRAKYADDVATTESPRDHGWRHAYDKPSGFRQGEAGFNEAVREYLAENGIGEYKQRCPKPKEARAFKHQRVFDLCTRADVPIQRCLVAWRTGSGKTRAMVQFLSNRYAVEDCRPIFVVAPKQSVVRNFYEELLSPDNPNPFRAYVRRYFQDKHYGAPPKMPYAQSRPLVFRKWTCTACNQINEHRFECRKCRVLKLEARVEAREVLAMKNNVHNAGQEGYLPAPLRILTYVQAGGNTMWRNDKEKRFTNTLIEAVHTAKEHGTPLQQRVHAHLSATNFNPYQHCIVVCDEVHNMWAPPADAPKPYKEKSEQLFQWLREGVDVMFVGLTATPVRGDTVTELEKQWKKVMELMRGPQLTPAHQALEAEYLEAARKKLRGRRTTAPAAAADRAPRGGGDAKPSPAGRPLRGSGRNGESSDEGYVFLFTHLSSELYAEVTPPFQELAKQIFVRMGNPQAEKYKKELQDQKKVTDLTVLVPGAQVSVWILKPQTPPQGSGKKGEGKEQEGKGKRKDKGEWFDATVCARPTKAKGAQGAQGSLYVTVDRPGSSPVEMHDKGCVKMREGDDKVVGARRLLGWANSTVPKPNQIGHGESWQQLCTLLSGPATAQGHAVKLWEIMRSVDKDHKVLIVAVDAKTFNSVQTAMHVLLAKGPVWVAMKTLGDVLLKGDALPTPFFEEEDDRHHVLDAVGVFVRQSLELEAQIRTLAERMSMRAQVALDVARDTAYHRAHEAREAWVTAASERVPAYDYVAEDALHAGIRATASFVGDSMSAVLRKAEDKCLNLRSNAFRKFGPLDGWSQWTFRSKNETALYKKAVIQHTGPAALEAVEKALAHLHEEGEEGEAESAWSGAARSHLDALKKYYSLFADTVAVTGVAQSKRDVIAQATKYLDQAAKVDASLAERVGKLKPTVGKNADAFKATDIVETKTKFDKLHAEFNTQRKGGSWTGEMPTVALINAKEFGEGVSFYDVDRIVLVNPPESFTQYQQLVGRALRACKSHPRHDGARTVQLDQYVAMCDGVKTVDEWRIDMLKKQQLVVGQFDTYIAEVAIDVSLYTPAPSSSSSSSSNSTAHLGGGSTPPVSPSARAAPPVPPSAGAAPPVPPSAGAALTGELDALRKLIEKATEAATSKLETVKTHVRKMLKNEKEGDADEEAGVMPTLPPHLVEQLTAERRPRSARGAVTGGAARND